MIYQNCTLKAGIEEVGEMPHSPIPASPANLVQYSIFF